MKKKHGISVSMQLLGKALVHPKDKEKKRKIPVEAYTKSRATIVDYIKYIGEKGRKIRHETEWTAERCKKSTTGIHWVRAKGIWKEFLTKARWHHIAKTNHVLDWEGAEEVENQTRTSQRRF